MPENNKINHLAMRERDHYEAMGYKLQFFDENVYDFKVRWLVFMAY